MQNTPHVNSTVAKLTERIEKAKAEHADLYQLQAIEPTVKRERRMQAVLENLGRLKTLRLRYMTDERTMLAYERALDTGRYLNAPITDGQRQLFTERIAACRDAMAKIDAEVQG